MLERLVLVAVVIATAYWYWQGPYQDRVNPDRQTLLERNEKAMADCLRAKSYQRGATGSGLAGDLAEEECARQLNLYFEDGHWQSYGTNPR